jgi:hypothetical protein
MVRKRLAVLALAGSLLASAGCATMSDCSAFGSSGSSSFLSRFRLRNRANGNGHDAECCDTGIPVAAGCANGACGLEGPSLFAGETALAPAPLPGTMPVLPGPTPMPGPTSAPPRIVTVPQAQPMPSPP